MMVGNSMKSDVVPMIEAGGWGVFVPTDLIWALERAEAPEDHPKYHQINDLSGLPAILDRLG
jgi:putative hydrolase of the HAD superfamily